MAIVRFNFGNIVHTNVHSETHEYIYLISYTVQVLNIDPKHML